MTKETVEMEHVETVIIGAGQAGLAMSYHLRQIGAEHVVLERARVAERWRTQRWDSLMFQFPNWSIELPGRMYSGGDPNGFSHKGEVVKFLEEYCELIAVPLRTGVNVTSLLASSRAGRYRLVTDQGEFEARNVVIATGPYQVPKKQPLSSAFPGHIVQIHAGDYRSPAALPPGAVLVVGTGASGCQIAEELLEAGRRVYLSVGRHQRVPRRYRGRDVFWWRRELGYMDRTTDTTPRAQRMPAPLISGVNGGHDVNLRQYAASGVTLLGHLRGVRELRVSFDADLENTLKLGDLTYDDFTRDVDDYVSRTGFDAPRLPSDADLPRETPASVGEIDLRAAAVGSVIWATGYTRDFSWVELPILDESGEPVHHRGVTRAAGVYLLGMPWLYKLKSSFLCGVGEDAEHLAERIHSAR